MFDHYNNNNNKKIKWFILCGEFGVACTFLNHFNIKKTNNNYDYKYVCLRNSYKKRKKSLYHSLIHIVPNLYDFFSYVEHKRGSCVSECSSLLFTTIEIHKSMTKK